MHEDFDKADMASFQLAYNIRRPRSPIIFALKATQVSLCRLPSRDARTAPLTRTLLRTQNPLVIDGATSGFQGEGESVSGEGVLDNTETEQHYNMNQCAGSTGMEI